MKVLHCAELEKRYVRASIFQKNSQTQYVDFEVIVDCGIIETSSCSRANRLGHPIQTLTRSYLHQ
jgi:hypothetical protein